MRSRFALGFSMGLLVAIAGRGTARADTAGTAERIPAGKRAVVVLVGALGTDTELSTLLRELLESSDVSVDIFTAETFESRELLRAQPRADAVYVYIVPDRNGGPRLYFRGPDGERFLLRRLPARAVFDDVGREQIGQTIQTAVDSLERTNEGLTRDQARAALDAEGEGAPKSEPPPVLHATPRPLALEPATRGPPHAEPRAEVLLEGWFALHYGATLLTTDIAPAHGPGLELGLGVVGSRYFLRVRGVIEDDFRQTVTTSAVGAELHGYRLRLAADTGLLLSPTERLLVSVAAGQDRTTITPLAMSAGVTPVAPFVDIAPIAHGELRYELSSGIARAAAALGVDLALVDTHFDIEEAQHRKRVLSFWLLRPTFGVAVALAPRWKLF